MKVLAIIPSRWASSRLPGKPLVDIARKTMIQRVYEQTKKAVSDVWIATDDSRIVDEANRFNGKVILTDKNHKNGTARCIEACQKIENEAGVTYDIVLNIQGDEPLLHPEQISSLIGCFETRSTDIATLVLPLMDEERINNPSNVKVVTDKEGFALYFSRSIIPYLRDINLKDVEKTPYLEHIGMYGFRREVLFELKKLSPSPLEEAEKLEQLRWLQEGYKIKVAKTTHLSQSVDTPEDLERINHLIDCGLASVD